MRSRGNDGTEEGDAVESHDGHTDVVPNECQTLARRIGRGVGVVTGAIHQVRRRPHGGQRLGNGRPLVLPATGEVAGAELRVEVSQHLVAALGQDTGGNLGARARFLDVLAVVLRNVLALVEHRE